MPSLKEALNADTSGYSQVDPGSAPAPALSQDLQPTRNPMVRCPLPALLTQASPDSLRQFYVGGQVPQTRIFTPSPTSSTGGAASATHGNVSVTTVVETAPTSTTTSSSTNTSSTSGAIQQATATTPVLNPGDRYAASLAVSKACQLLTISASVACRLQIYGSSVAQTRDGYRGIDVAPPAGTAQGIVTDLALDTAPYQWSFQNRIASNSDSPTTGTLYLTVTNLGEASSVITVTLSYVALEA